MSKPYYSENLKGLVTFTMVQNIFDGDIHLSMHGFRRILKYIFDHFNKQATWTTPLKKSC